MQVDEGQESFPGLSLTSGEDTGIYNAHTDNERRLLAQYTVSSVLLEAATLEEAAQGTLQAIGKTLNWELGAFWRVNQENSLLYCVATWHTPALEAEDFAAVSRQNHFEPGIGLPGRVWQSGNPIWVSDIRQESNFPRIAVAHRAGLHSAFGFPISSKNGILGVIEFFSRENRTPDETLIRTVITIGNQVGQFIEKQLAQESHRVGELRHAAIVQTALDAIVTIDAQSRILEFNPAAEKMFGYRRDEALGQDMAQLLIPPSLRQRHYAGLRRYLDSGQGKIIGHRLEMRAMRADRREFPIELTITRISPENPPLFTGYIRDNTQRKLLVEALHQSADEAQKRAGELSTIIEAISDGLLVYDAQGLPVQTNAAFRELLSIDLAPDFLTLPASERFSRLHIRDEYGQLISEEQWSVRRILRGEVLKGATTVDYTIRALDGRDLQANVSGSPIRDRDGTILGGVSIMRDVTERRRLERRTQESLNALLDMARTIIETPEEAAKDGVNMPTAIDTVAQRLAELICSVLDCKRVAITTIEPATGEHRSVAAVGLTPEQEHFWRSRAPEYYLSEPLRDTLERLRASEVVIVNASQPEFNLQSNPFGIRSMLGAPMLVGEQLVGILSLDYGSQDHVYTQEEIALAGSIAKLAALIIERERLLRERAEGHASELALRETNRRMDEFLGMTSHELKTPLTSIKGNTQLALRQIRNAIERGEASPLFSRLRSQLESTDDQVRRLNRLVEDLLDVSRIQSDHLEILPSPSDLTMLVQEAVKEQRLAWPRRTITLNLPADRKAVRVLADADRIRQVITNYLTNALKYSEEDRPVEVTLRVADQQAIVSVRDEGIGISVEKQHHIWDRFYRVHSPQGERSSRELHAGLGLGLYISKTIIEHHHGTVGLQSTPGNGSTFWFSLPILQSP